MLINLPSELREKVMPVIHAKQPAHLEFCLQNYQALLADSHRIGFGSFSTMGATNSINRVNVDVLRLLDDLAPRLNGSRLHSLEFQRPLLFSV